MAHRDIIASKYWNTNRAQVAIVAIQGGNNDVAAYIGGTQDVQREEDTLKWVVEYGAKLTDIEAHRMLSELGETMRRLGLHYRR